MKHTEKQIVESIVKWSAYMLENNMATEDDLREVVNEGLLKRAIGAVRRGAQNVKDFAYNVKSATKEALHDIFKTNEGVKKMLDAIDNAVKNGKTKIQDLKLYATLGDASQTFPVKDFAMKGKRGLLLLIDKAMKNVKPKTVDDLRKFFIEKLGEDTKPKDAIEWVYCAEAPDAALATLSESKLTDYLDSKKLSKKDALKPETLKEIKRTITHQNDEKTKAAIETYYASKPAEDSASKKASTTKKSTKKTSAKAKLKADAGSETKANEPSAEPMEKPKDADASIDKKASKDAIKLFDNKLLDVKADKDSVGFIFSKSKAELALDKQLAKMFES